MASRPFFVRAIDRDMAVEAAGTKQGGSSTSGRLVAASTITLSLGENPSISVRIWLRVCSRSS